MKSTSTPDEDDLAPRSWLYVPGNRPDRIRKAIGSSADAVIVDLEDACPFDDKEKARNGLRDLAPGWPKGRCYVRINSNQGDFCLQDLEAVVGLGVAGVVLPKAQTAEDVRSIDWAMTQLERRSGLPVNGITLIPLIETARGLMNVGAIASAGATRLRRLTFGAGDYTADLGIRWSQSESELAWARSMLAIASRAADLAPPIDTPWAAIDDRAGLEHSAALALGAGFGGKAAIHPGQIDAINAVFTPSEAQVEQAKRLLAAYQSAALRGEGALQVDGRLIDHVVIEQSRRILSASRGRST